MWDLLRDSTFGQLCNWLSSGRLFSFPEQRPGFVPPPRFRRQLVLSPSRLQPTPSRPAGAFGPALDGAAPIARQQSLVEAALTRTRSRSTTMHQPERDRRDSGRDDGGARRIETIVERSERSGEGSGEGEKAQPLEVVFEDDDPDCPRNWSKGKRSWTAFLIALYTFTVYVASASYTPAIPMISDKFGVSLTVATLGLTLFVVGYGSAPMLLSPLQEMATVGRNPVYIIGLFCFVLFQMPPPIAGNSLPVLLVFRFLAGVAGSPALATGGASMQGESRVSHSLSPVNLAIRRTDLFPPIQQPMAIGVWAMGATCGPVISGFAVQIMGWRYAFYELLWLGGFTFAILFFLLPETLDSAILLRRARRLRKALKNQEIKTGCEINEIVNVKWYDILAINAKRAVRLSLEPAILVANLNLALVYAILYLFFESFPLVFSENHGFNIGETGLAFLCFAVPAPFTFAAYWWYQKYVIEPRILRPKPGHAFQPEMRLEIGLIAGIIVPIALLIFGWTGRDPDVHWIWPMVGAGLYLPGIFYSFQSILMYVGVAYPAYAASIFAGNDFFRSNFAAPFPLFGRAFFKGLGIGGGNTFLAVASIFTTVFLYLIYRFGGRLRAASKFTG
ncbi:hypothetical protein JCM8097_000866 [Rhodosporidiobolus ruineniae]